MARHELLSPAGDFEKLKAAVRYGADAVYFAGQAFGMRAASGNFTNDEILEAVEYCHARGVKVYVTVNVMPRDSEYPLLREYVKFLATSGIDAAIVADLGVLALFAELAPDMEIHVSTQASSVSSADCIMWHKLGAKRIVLARELSLEEIRTIRRNIPDDIELETFVHGAMCIAYSGRCLMSNYFVGRDANHGMCAQPCRWNYSEAKIVEEKRPDDVLSVEQDGGDTFIMSSRDMCMIEHIPELMEAGITSFKIEGRVKSAYYTAVVTNTYRMAMDAYLADPEGFKYDPTWMSELESVSHREYATGFFFGSPHESACTVTQPGYIREKAYLATALTDSDEDGRVVFVQRNKVVSGTPVELLTVGKAGIPASITDMLDSEGTPTDSAPRPGMIFSAKLSVPVTAGDILRQG